jgi:hypothetical protein
VGGVCGWTFPEGAITEEWLKPSAKEIVRPFSAVDVDLLWPRPEPPHTEDWVVDPDYRVVRGVTPPEERDTLLDRLDDGAVDAIFGAPVCQGPGWYVEAGHGRRSLGTVSPRALWEVCYYADGRDDRWNYYLRFTDQAGKSYRLQVTDLAFRRYLDCMRRRRKKSPVAIEREVTAFLQDSHLHLRIGLARGWTKYPDRCFLQITGVYSFPDYLSGRCFADL